MAEGAVHQGVTFVPNYQVAKFFEPGEEPLDAPALKVAPHATPVVGPVFRGLVGAMRCEQLTVDVGDVGSQFVSLVRLIGDASLRPARGSDRNEIRNLFDRGLPEHGLAVVRSGALNSARKSLADDQNS